MRKYDVFGLGSAVMDILVMAEETELLKLNIKKGVMKLVDEKELMIVLDKINHLTPVIAPGGSVANTCAGIARLGGSSLFCGVVGDDKHGTVYEEAMKKDGVKVRITKEEGKGWTATAVTFVTPDSERSFMTHLGVSLHLAKKHILKEDIMMSKTAHFEGYLIENPKTKAVLLHAMKLAREHDTIVSFDVSDAHLIERTKKDMLATIEEYVDVLFLNEEESYALTKKPVQESLDILSKIASTVIIKQGAKGSIIRMGEEQGVIKGIPAKAKDTTGAGDMYAAGFLYGLARNLPLETCGKIASFSAAKVVEKMGARIGFSLSKDVARIIAKK